MYTKWLEINFCLTQEQLVVVHLSGIIDTEYLKKCDSTNCKILVIMCFPLIVCLGKFLYKQVFYSQKSLFSRMIIDVYTEWYDIWKMICNMIWYICNMGYESWDMNHMIYLYLVMLLNPIFPRVLIQKSQFFKLIRCAFVAAMMVLIG